MQAIPLQQPTVLRKHLVSQRMECNRMKDFFSIVESNRKPFPRPLLPTLQHTEHTSKGLNKAAHEGRDYETPVATNRTRLAKVSYQCHPFCCSLSLPYTAPGRLVWEWGGWQHRTEAALGAFKRQCHETISHGSNPASCPPQPCPKCFTYH